MDQKELTSALNAAFPESTFMGMISPPQSKTPKPEGQLKMEAALPDSAPAKPLKPRKVLVLITTENLKKYDLVFLDSTTGFFLDNPRCTGDCCA